MKLNKWLDRAVISSPYCYTLCTSQNMFEKNLKKFGIEPFHGVVDGKGATAHFFPETKKNARSAIVCIFDHSHNLIEIYALLVHEAVHIWQHIEVELNDKFSSDEFEAWSIQRIALNLFAEYERQMKGNRVKIK